ncbi:FGGY-family carbohydrate kinase [Luedemannella flava]
MRAAGPLPHDRTAGHGRRQPHLAPRQDRGVRRPDRQRGARQPRRGHHLRRVRPDPPHGPGRRQRRPLHPWLYGERAPVDDPNLRAGFFNISLGTNRSDLLRAVFEGVALNTRWLAAAVDRFLGSPVTSLVITGGGAQSDAWCQIFADVLGVEIRRDANPVAVNARGAGWIGAVGAGLISFADIPGLMRNDHVFTPTAAHRATYDEIFGVYQDLHKRLAPIYRRLNA